MGFKKLQVPRSRVKKVSRRIDASWSKSSLSVRSFVSKLSLTNFRSSLNRPVTSCPVPVTIQCGFSDHVSRHVALAAGSYFDVEAALLKGFARTRRPGSIKSTQVGFMSPYYSTFNNVDHRRPTYEDVMTGTSGYVMVVLVELTDPVSDFEDLIRFFFQIHDPTTKYRQGNDRGFQFASWIFCGDQEQYEVAKRVRAEVQELLDHGLFKHVYNSHSVTTSMSLMSDFIPGPECHQKHFLTHTGESDGIRTRYDSWPTLGSDDASSMGLVSISSDEDEKLEVSAKSSLHFRPKESLVHSMIRISMCDRPEDDGSAV